MNKSTQTHSEWELPTEEALRRHGKVMMDAEAFHEVTRAVSMMSVAAVGANTIQRNDSLTSISSDERSSEPQMPTNARPNDTPQQLAALEEVNDEPTNQTSTAVQTPLAVIESAIIVRSSSETLIEVLTTVPATQNAVSDPSATAGCSHSTADDQKPMNEDELINSGRQTVDDARKAHQPIPSLAIPSEGANKGQAYYQSHSKQAPRYKSISPPQRYQAHPSHANESVQESTINLDGEVASPKAHTELIGRSISYESVREQSNVSEQMAIGPDSPKATNGAIITSSNTEADRPADTEMAVVIDEFENAPLRLPNEEVIMKLLMQEVREMGPEVEQALLAQAKERGITPDATPRSPRTEEAIRIQQELDKENESSLNPGFLRYRPSPERAIDSDCEDSEPLQSPCQATRGRGRGRENTRPPLPPGMSYKKKTLAQPVLQAQLTQAIGAAQLTQLNQHAQTAQPAHHLQCSGTGQTAQQPMTTPLAHVRYLTNEQTQPQPRPKQTRPRWSEEDDTQGGQAGTSTGTYTQSGRKIDAQTTGPQILPSRSPTPTDMRHRSPSTEAHGQPRNQARARSQSFGSWGQPEGGSSDRGTTQVASNNRFQ